MLTTILNNVPPPKFVIIQDSIVLKGKDVLGSIVKAHYDMKREIHYFCFSTPPNELNLKFQGENFKIYDYFSDSKGWLNKSLNFDDDIKNISGIIIIDSLTNFIFEYNLPYCYKILNKLISQPNIFQITTILHVDCLENKLNTLKYLEHICTLNLKLILINNNKRIEYIHKKSSSKIVKNIEEYHFETNILKTKSLEKIDPKKILGPTEMKTVPENLSTFKISLEETEKISREGLVLPYVTKAGGNVIYNLDDEDDWDDEDPDDDLDI